MCRCAIFGLFCERGAYTRKLFKEVMVKFQFKEMISMSNHNVNYQTRDNRRTNRYSNSANQYERRNRQGYEDGNTVRKYQPQIQRDDDDVSQIQRDIRIKKERDRQRDARFKRMRARWLETTKMMDLSSFVVLSLAVVVLLIVLVDYISIKSDLTTMSKEIATETATYNSMKAKNDSLQKEVESSINLQDIYKVATEELGMVFADESQVIKYQFNESAYVRQYEDLPEVKDDDILEDITSAIK